MNAILADKINKGASGHIYASFNDRGQIRLVRIGTYAEVRHRYNQMVCLIGAVAMESLLKCSPTSVHSRSAPPGTWVDRFDGKAMGTPGELFSLAAGLPSDAADLVGYNTSHGHWPQGMTMLLSGYKAMVKCTSELSNIMYSCEFKPTVTVGCSPDVSAAKRTKEAIARAKTNGYTVFEEDALLRFLETLQTARFLHFFHQVTVD